MPTIIHYVNIVIDRYATVDVRWLAVAIAFQLSILVLRASAWKSVLRAAYPRKHVRLKHVGAAYAAGVALNAYTPARAGEALKVALIRLRLSGSSVPALAASNSVILAFDLMVGVALIVAAWAMGIAPALPELSLKTAAVPVLLILAVATIVAVSPRLRARLREGGAILAHPRQYLRQVVPVQLGAWVCRLGVAFALLAAFGLPSTIVLAGLVIIADSVSTLVPTPGGAGAQQVLVVYALQNVATASAALSFSIGMQVGITAMNTIIGIAGLVIIFGTLRPGAIWAGLRVARQSA